MRSGKGAVGALLLGLLAASCAAPDRLDALPGPVRSTGTGFFATPAGDLFTAAHVVEGCPALWVTVGGRHLAPASVAAIQHDLDLALLRTALPTDTARVGLTPSHPVPGSWLTAIGYPVGERATGAVRVPFRAILVPLPDERAMVRGIAQPGMSGSPLVDGAGQVAGMLLARGDSARPDAPALEARLGLSADELALAVPAPWMRAVASVAGLALPTEPGTQPPQAHKSRTELAVVQVLCTDE